MSKSTIDHVLIGHVGVDSGMVMIGDPSYLAEFVNNDYERKPVDADQEEFDFSYSGACGAAMQSGGQLATQPGICSGVVSGIPQGDGIYPVLQVVKDGQVVGLYIHFSGDH